MLISTGSSSQFKHTGKFTICCRYNGLIPLFMSDSQLVAWEGFFDFPGVFSNLLDLRRGYAEVKLSLCIFVTLLLSFILLLCLFSALFLCFSILPIIINYSLQFCNDRVIIAGVVCLSVDNHCRLLFSNIAPKTKRNLDNQYMVLRGMSFCAHLYIVW